MKYFIVNLPLIGRNFQRIYQKIERQKGFLDSKSYWINRYEIGGKSGSGSYDKLAQFKAEQINSFVAEHDIKTVIEYGCGDGNQLRYANYPGYIGFDISPRAIKICQNLYKQDSSKQFYILEENYVITQRSDLMLSFI